MQKNCALCTCRFFADENDCLSGSWICSYCKPKCKICLNCGKAYTGRLKTMDSLCHDCREEGASLGFSNTWLFLRFKTLRRDGFTCRYCGRSPLYDFTVVLEIDHIRARSKHGTDESDNLVTSCRECNHGKVDIMLEKSEEWKVKQRRIKNGELGDPTKKQRLEQVGNIKTAECVVADSSHVGEGDIQTGEGATGGT